MQPHTLKLTRAHPPRKRGQRWVLGVGVCGCETVAGRLLGRVGSRQEEAVIGSMHPSPGMNKSLFINTPYWEFLNEMISASTSGGEERGVVLCDPEVASSNP